MKALILVADAGRARLFASETRAAPWKLLEQLEHPEVRSARDTLSSAQPGRTQESMATGRRSALAPPASPKEVETEKFAATLAEKFAQAAAEDAFERLVVVAPPRFLGLLREHLGAGEARMRDLVGIDKDLSQAPDAELPARVADELVERDLPAL